MKKLAHVLDHNRLYQLQISYDSAGKQLAVTVTDHSQPWPRFVDAITGLLNVTAEGHKISRHRHGNTVTFAPFPAKIVLQLGGEVIGRYTLSSNGALKQTFHRPLTVTETRRIGTFHHEKPYPERRKKLSAEQNDALLETARRAVFTDFHTHSSGQISARGLLAVASKHKAYYPLALLKEAGIDSSYRRFAANLRKQVKRVPFPPLERPGLPDTVEAVPLAALREEELKQLELHMSVPADRQSTYTTMEYDAYRFRYPLTKNKALLSDTLIRMAQEYVAQGITCAEIAFVGLDQPDLLKSMHEAMAQIEADPKTKNFSLRFMAAIPRSLPIKKIEELLERTKILAESPYITGIDFVGYEVNKTKAFTHALDNFARWANEHKPGFHLRAHAGENDKNLGNVREFLELVARHPNLHGRIGHGVYGMDKAAIRLACALSSNSRKPRLTLEFNPDSNLALNNIDDVRQVPFGVAIKHGIPFIVGSDSAGTYQTSAIQLGLSAFHAGLDAAGFARLRKHQQYLVQQQRKLAKKAEASIPRWNTKSGRAAFVSRLIARLKKVPAAPLPAIEKVHHGAIEKKLKAQRVTLLSSGEKAPELEKRTPVTVVGASGQSWHRLSRAQQHETAIAIDMLAHALDPEKSYFVQGRNKPLGLSKLLNAAIKHANAQAKRSFYVLGLLVEPRFDEQNSYHHLTHMQRIDGKLLDLADAIVEHTFQHAGTLIAAGGAAFTRDIILKADQRGMLDDAPHGRKMMLLLGNAAGASAEKAAGLDPAYRAGDGKVLLTKLFALQPAIFRKDFTLKKLAALDKAARKRALSYYH